MTDQLREIGVRLAALREISDMSAQETAARLGMDESEYLLYESGEKDFSFSFLYNAASIFGVDVLDIMDGESPKLSICSVVRKGQGFSVQRNNAYDYKHLAHTFRDKKAEPFLVTVVPTDEKAAMHAHEGQEFNMLLSGRMNVQIGTLSYDLEAGDSLYFDSGVPHAMFVLGSEPAQFLAVVIK